MWLDIKKQLGQVSRSFALCIPFLEEGLRENVGIAYLMLRALDSIEDSLMPKVTKDLCYEKFNELITQKNLERSSYYDFFGRQNWKGLKDSEVNFMSSKDFSRITEYYWELEESYRLSIANCIQEMAHGMKKYSDPGNKDAFMTVASGKKILRNKNFYDDYCYYVAGTVGVLLTRLSLNFYSAKLVLPEPLKHLSLAFGRVLQKVNIIKDCRQDYKKGRCFLPQTFVKHSCSQGLHHVDLELILKDLKNDFLGAKDYIFSLPKKYKAFKQFCLLALIPAYKTLIYIKKNQKLFYEKNKSLKIPKTQMLQCFSMVARGVVKKDLVEKLHSELYEIRETELLVAST